MISAGRVQITLRRAVPVLFRVLMSQCDTWPNALTFRAWKRGDGPLLWDVVVVRGGQGADGFGHDHACVE